MRIVVALGLFAHFIALASAQVIREAASGAQALKGRFETGVNR
jgi:hypothetical protein